MNMRQIAGSALALLLVTTRGAAQAITTTGVERETGQPNSWRLVYDNDFFRGTDRYFTQGIMLEVFDTRLAHIPLMRLLPASRSAVVKRGVAYEDDGYTASDLKAPDILQGDHPYAGTKQLRLLSIALDTIHQQRITAALTLGIIGQGAGGAAIQTFIHRHTGNTIPRGWVHQIRNDAIVNYEIGIERAVLQAGRSVMVSAAGMARAGTFNTALSVGATTMIGRIGTPFAATSSGRRWFYLYATPQLQAVGHDATLQGGLFNRSSPYTVPAGDVARLVYRQRVGLVYRSGSRFIEYFHSTATPEFRGARAHRSGGLLIGVGHSR
jgi:lipid A 3-O-deacylase